MLLSWTCEGWANYIYWLDHWDRETFKRINRLIKDILRDPFTGIGRPVPLLNDFRGAWSRRVNHINRIVYRVLDDEIVILSIS